MDISRRKFITGGAVAGALTFLPGARVQAAPKADSYATLIDLEKCDGCPKKKTPACVAACRQGRGSDFPQPAPEKLRDYWPQNRHEDWSDKKGITDRFTPYTWIFVQRVTVGGREIAVPRRCMHCDNPPCAKLCPFGVKHKTADGPVYIDQHLCFGGAKCRTVCPWSVPQRQAGVGIYTLWQEYLPVGGGVMYKCDLCRQRLAAGKRPHCIEACPQDAMFIGRRDRIFAEAERRRKQYGGHIYGMDENGGTSTIYVSAVDFSDIDKALAEQAAGMKTRHVPRLDSPDNMLDKQKPWALISLISPLLGIAAAVGLTWNSGKKES